MAPTTSARALVWLRRDLRLGDNVALWRACAHADEVAIAFNVEPELLASKRIGAPIVQTFFEALAALREDLRARGSDLAIVQGDAVETIPKLARALDVSAVYFNEDYDPRAIDRDQRVVAHLEERGIDVHPSLDHVVFGADEIRTDAGEPYKVYTPYARRWREHYAQTPRLPVTARDLNKKLLSRHGIGTTLETPTPSDFGYATSDAIARCSEAFARASLRRFLKAGGAVEKYATQRDLPALDATSHLSIQLRAGTIGVRECFALAFAAGGDGARLRNVQKWISELIWREFYQMILRNFPKVDGSAFVDAANELPWENDKAMFARWCEGKTGYPIVDAAMRQLNQTGWMHNRLRMIVASFLTKDLAIDWRWGERYFEQHLADADLAQNNGGWQWAASTGTDAAPYFRVFNPILQSKKFDPDGTFIRRFVPELRDVPDDAIHAPWEAEPGLFCTEYPQPIVDHYAARTRTLEAYAPILGKNARRSSDSETRKQRPR